MTRRRLVVLLALATALWPAAVATASDSSGSEDSRSPEQRAAALVAQMTLDEKIAELHGIQNAQHRRFVPGVPRLGIPPLVITNGPAGVGPGDAPQQPPATALPAPISLAATWDRSAAGAYGAVQGSETRDLAESLIEAPDVNLARVPENGRTFESYGEDPYLDGQVAVANIDAVQRQRVIAEVKHLAANNQESSRFSINELIDDRTLHEMYLPHFEAAVRDAHAGTVMCAYPRIDGVFSCDSAYLLTDVLRGQWGFDGFVQSDFGAAHSTVLGAQAGMDLEMPSGVFYSAPMLQAVQSGQVGMGSIDTLLVRRFATMIRFGLFDNPVSASPIPAQADGAVARRLAEQGMVLLRNEGAQLPLDAAALHSIAVIGPGAGAAITGGGGSSHVVPLYTVSPVAGIQSRVGPNVAVSVADGSDLARAAAAARSADVAVVMVGDSETEGHDRTALALPGTQDALVEAVAAANPHTVVVVKSGGPVLMPWAGSVPAILEAWYPGEEDGNAVASLLFGDVDPSGKLPITFPASDAQTPAHTPRQWPGVNGVADYSEGLDVGYRYYDANGLTPLFPFGYGLSYTTFAFHDLRIGRRQDDGHVEVGVDVTNTGRRAGAEVAQLYVQDPAAAGEPPRQLKGFQRVELRPGQTRHLTFTLDQRAFSVWSSAAQAWEALDGRYQVLVGDSSRSLPLHREVMVRDTTGPQSVTVSAPPVVDPGQQVTVTATVHNLGDASLHDVRLSLRTPAGWTSAPHPAAFEVVGAHGSAHASWQVRAPAGGPSAATLSASASFHLDAREEEEDEDEGGARGQRTVTVAYPSLAFAFDDVGVSDDANPAVGAFTASGRSYSAEALASVGITPGATITHHGISFRWPSPAPGTVDNVESGGQVVEVPGSGDHLAFLGASTSGSRGGIGIVSYTDGSTQQFTIAFPDWSTPGAGNDVVATTPYSNGPAGRDPHTGSIYYASVPLAAGKRVAGVTLPDTGAPPGNGMHVFAVAIGQEVGS